ncbi:substrate-binding domain-containing protein [Phycicoccus sp. Root101]|uniref:substrate-binding domain-containing protein n=1 Tax=Phycicoccus sp. Root101 TaxID=1736421 RepID=UPI0007024A81|nr:substrate-binding domain-containing protein [Phycicoccus sp. Root101]KQU64131.1 hypothetical protein ASC58_19665 [Phycicoccus sp. Root101]
MKISRKLAPVLVLVLLSATACSKASTVSSSGGGGSSDGSDKLAGSQTLQGYDSLPFKDILAMPEGDVKVAGKEKILLGFSQTCFNHPWRKAMLESVLAEVKRHPNVSVVTVDGNCDAAKQSNDIDDLMARGVDAIIMSPVESAGLAPAARRVMAKKMPLVLLDRDVPAEKTVFIGQSNVEMAYETAKKMIADMNGKGNIVEITGLSGSSPATDRSTGLKKALAEAPGMKLLAVGDGQWVREPAVKVMDDWLTKYPKIDAVFSHAEESSWGAMQAIKNAGRCNDNIKEYTHDGSAPGFKAVKEGQFQADGNYSPFIGDIGVRAALGALEGKPIDGAKAYSQPGSYLQLPNLPLVTAENADQWVPKGWGTFELTKNPCK